MNILFLTMLRVDSFSCRNLYTDLMREFIKKGHKVTVLCPLERRYGTKEKCIEEVGNRIIQIPTGNLFQTTLIEKGISTLLLETAFINAVKRRIGKKSVDLVIYSTPPITFARVIQYIKKNNGAASYLLLKDIFPQNAVDLKMFSKKSLLHWFFRRKEKKLYQFSDYIGCMSDKNREYLLANNRELSRKNIEVCPNTITVDSECSISTEEKQAFREQLNNALGIPKDAVVFLYGGNFGKPQGVEYIIKCLDAYRDRKDIFFLLCGKGTEYSKIDTWIKENAVKNTYLISWLEQEKYKLLSQCCDVGLIFLNKDFTIPNFPSRLLSYLEAGIPVLAATDKNTDIGQVITEGGFGFWCESCKVEDFREEVGKLLKDTESRREMGIRARKFLEDNWTSEKAYEIIMKHFE